MPPQLVALTEGPDILLDKPILLIGRHQECDILIPSRKISRRHCLIAQVHDYLVVRDLFSTNGIRVNGIRVKEGTLRSGDEFTIGNYRYEVRFNGLPAGPVAAKPSPQVPKPEPRPRAPVEEVFESCEIPVALAEPLDRAVPLGFPLGQMLAKHPPFAAGQNEPASPGVDSPAGPAVIPDNLDLAPLSAETQPKKPST